MSDLIDRQALLEWFKNWSDYDEFSVGYITGIIEDEPSAVRHGRWMYKAGLGWGETWVCSECGERTTSTAMGKPRYKYCPMCGAIMDGE